MDRKIIIYGMGAFSDAADVFAKDCGRFDYAQRGDADVIVLSLHGMAYGHFDIADKERPNDEDRRICPTVKAIYIVKKPTTLYENPVRLLPLGIKGIQFGRSVSEEQLQQIQVLAGKPGRDIGASYGEEKQTR